MPMSTAGNRPSNAPQAAGFTYLVVLVALIVIGIMAETVTRSTYAERRREDERQLLFVGMAYYNAIRQFHQDNGRYPRALSDLLLAPNAAHRVYLRDLYPDPMQPRARSANGNEWRLIRAADGGIAGVASRSDRAPMKRLGFPLGFEQFETAATYSEWEFEYNPAAKAKPPGRP